MQPTISKLRFSLANAALNHFFNNQYWTKDEVIFLQSFCQINNSDMIWKLKMRLLCEENNDMIVAAVLADSSDEMRNFIYDKYLNHFSFVQIGGKLHIHPNSLHKWRNNLLNDIAFLLEYKLPINDIFSRNKVEALIYVLERTITFHEEYGNANKEFLTSLKLKLDNYQNLLFTLKQYLHLHSQNIGQKIIRIKILNPSISAHELEKQCRCSHTTINHYINQFQKFHYPQNHN